MEDVSLDVVSFTESVTAIHLHYMHKTFHCFIQKLLWGRGGGGGIDVLSFAGAYVNNVQSKRILV